MSRLGLFKNDMLIMGIQYKIPGVEMIKML